MVKMLRDHDPKHLVSFAKTKIIEEEEQEPLLTVESRVLEDSEGLSMVFVHQETNPYLQVIATLQFPPATSVPSTYSFWILPAFSLQQFQLPSP